jgi:hypothetical protein
MVIGSNSYPVKGQGVVNGAAVVGGAIHFYGLKILQIRGGGGKRSLRTGNQFSLGRLRDFVM